MEIQKSSFDVFEEFKLQNLEKVMGGDHWRAGSTMPPPSDSGKTSDSDEELITSGSPNTIDSQYDCGDGKVLW